MKELIIGTGSGHDSQSAVGPELSLGAETMRRLHFGDERVATARAVCRGHFPGRHMKNPRHEQHAVATNSPTEKLRD
jgi:hypothetical protein